MKKVAILDYDKINRLPSGLTAFLDGMKEVVFVNSNFILKNGILPGVDIVLLYDALTKMEFNKKQQVIGMYRMPKGDQQIFLANNNLPNIPTLLPHYVSHDWRISMTKIVMDFMKEQGTSILLKISSGARGLGMKIIHDSKECHRFFQLLRYYRENEIDSLTEEQAHDLGIEQLGSEQFLKGNFIIQPFYEFREEYRVLAFHGQKPMIAKRKRKMNEVTGMVIANIRGDNENEIIPTNVSAYVVLDKLTKILLKATNSPWLSVDVGITSGGSIVILEFQMQAGISSFKFEDVQEKVQKSFLKKIGIK